MVPVVALGSGDVDVEPIPAVSAPSKCMAAGVSVAAGSAAMAASFRFVGVWLAVARLIAECVKMVARVQVWWRRGARSGRMATYLGDTWSWCIAFVASPTLRGIAGSAKWRHDRLGEACNR